MDEPTDSGLCQRHSLFGKHGRSLGHFRIQSDVFFPLIRDFVIDEDRIGWAFRFTGVAVDAGVGVDKDHRFAFVKTFDGAYNNAIGVLTLIAGFGDDVRHDESPAKAVEKLSSIWPCRSRISTGHFLLSFLYQARIRQNYPVIQGRGMTSASDNSAEIFASLARGSRSAPDRLFHRYIHRLSRLARSKLSPRLAQRIDPEDVVMSAYRSFFVAADAGRFSVNGAGDLWALLATITLRKLYRSAAHHSADKRSINREVIPDEDFDLNQRALSAEPSPEEALALSEELEQLLRSLSERDRRTVELRLQGHQIQEIAEELAVNEKTVRRSLQQIVAQCQQQHGLSDSSYAPLEQSVPSVERQTVPPSGFPNLDTTVEFEELVLHELIGRGGMGKVYKASRKESGELVAVKFLHKSLLSNERAASRILAEFESLRQLSHPTIVRIQGIGKTEAGTVFLVMGLLQGQPLSQLLSTATLPQFVEWLEQIAVGIQHAHSAGVVHCDLKPDNIIITDSGQAVITDFGLAQPVNANTVGAIGGSAPWMAPEQVDEHFGSISRATDVYGLGALMYTLLSGSPPFTGSQTADVLSQVVSGKVPNAPKSNRFEIPEALVKLCMRCLSKAPNARPESAAKVAEMLTATRP